jgi:hypothetical protein
MPRPSTLAICLGLIALAGCSSNLPPSTSCKPACLGPTGQALGLNATLRDCVHNFFVFELPVQNLGQPSNVTPFQQVPGILHVVPDVYHCGKLEASGNRTWLGVNLAIVVLPIEDPHVGNPAGSNLNFNYGLEAYTDNPFLRDNLVGAGFPAHNASFQSTQGPGAVQEAWVADNGASYQLTTTTTPSAGTLTDNLYRNYRLDGGSWAWMDILATEKFQEPQPCTGVFHGTVLDAALRGAPAMACTAALQSFQLGTLDFHLHR